MKVEGKPNVYDNIESDRESRAKPKKKAVSPAAGTVCWRKLQTTRHHTSGGLSPAFASASDLAATSAPDEVVEVFEYKGREYMRMGIAVQMSVPKEKSERAEKTRLQQELYGKQVSTQGHNLSTMRRPCRAMWPVCTHLTS